MDRLKELMVEVWRETGRQPEIAASTLDIAQLLGHWMPVQQVLVRRIEPERACIETVGVGPDGALHRSLGDRSDCAPATLQRLLAWCRGGEVIRWHRSGKTDRALAAAIPHGIEGELLVGPLASEHGTYGVVLLLAATPQCFTPLHKKMLQELLEPFAAALENDRRLRELTALREAAEADKQSLLRRLGRTETTDTIVGADGRLRPVMERVELVSRSDVPVLLLER